MNFYDLQRRNQIMATQSVSGCLIGPRVDGFLAQTSLAIVH
jgi:hypothetical protein